MPLHVNRTAGARHNPQAGGGEASDTSGIVVQYSNQESKESAQHETITRAGIAKKLAKLKGYAYGGEYDREKFYEAPLYFVPSDTIVGLETARRLGIASENELFGGIVPYPFVATKTITHPLLDASAFAPEGWSHDFPRRVLDAVLFGFSAFTRSEARRACARVLERGPARFKPACGVGGRGQKIITSLQELDAHLNSIDPDELARYGIAIEQHLEEVTTYSVGKVTLGDLCIAYYGTQCLTSDHNGVSVYGGSALLVTRGGFENLLTLDLTPELRQAVAQARTYDTAASEEFTGLIASRRNYDVAEGRDSQGRRVMGVLEQSWRIGGASSAEVAALETFQADPTLRVVRTSCTEIYDGDHEPPAGALVHFCGDDDRVGSIIKYTLIEPYGNAR
ncbi:MAG TPA: DUF3182 family protein [Candidatus Binatia bacterium]|nr:DUF3182 family protein [Candidatus Binatia bacterium]